MKKIILLFALISNILAHASYSPQEIKIKNECFEINYSLTYKLPLIGITHVGPNSFTKSINSPKRYYFHNYNDDNVKTLKYNDFKSIYHEYHRGHFLQGTLFNSRPKCKNLSYSYINIVPMSVKLNTKYWRYVEKLTKSFTVLDNTNATIIIKTIIDENNTKGAIFIPKSFIMYYHNPYRNFCFHIPNFKKEIEFKNYLNTHHSFRCSKQTIDTFKQFTQSL